MAEEDESLFEELVDSAIEAEEDLSPGETRAEAKRGLLRRGARIVAGVTLVVVGLFLLVLPGPGLLVIAAGLALLSRDVPFARRWLVRVRERLPEDDDGEPARWVIAGSIGVAVVSVGGSVWWVVAR
jgi:Putative transmembrane protein (PGPGW)